MQKKINTKFSVSVVIPVYNSEKSVYELTERIDRVLSNHDYEIILIDDASHDNSFGTIKKINNSKLTAIRLDKNYGQQNAVKCGIDYATKDYIITMDDDLQHRPEDILKLVEKCQKFDVVYGIYDYKQYHSLRSYGSKFVNHLFNKVLKKPEGIRISSFRCINKKTAEAVRKDTTSFVYLSAMIIKYTDKISNINVQHQSRKYGKSNYNYLKLMKLVIKLYIYYSDNMLAKLIRRKEPQYKIEEIWRNK